MKITTFILLCIISMSTTFAQSILKGEVLDSFGEPLHNSNILIKGTEQGTVTVNGEFAIKAKIWDTLVISHIGYQTQEIVLTNKAKQIVVLEVESFDEVLVIANVNHIKTYCTHTISVCCDCGVIRSNSNVSNILSKSTEIQPSLYPNPSPSGQYTIKFPKPYKTVSYNIITITGQLIQTQNVNLNSSDLTVDLSSFAAGIYLIQVEADGERLPTLKALKG